MPRTPLLPASWQRGFDSVRRTVAKQLRRSARARALLDNLSNQHWAIRGAGYACLGVALLTLLAVTLGLGAYLLLQLGSLLSKSLEHAEGVTFVRQMQQHYVASRRGQPRTRVPPSPSLAQLQDLKVGAVVFYRLRHNLRILNKYLERNLISSAGLLHEVIFVICTEDEEDIDFLHGLLRRHPVEYRAVVKPKEVATSPRLASSYLGLYPDRLYIKIDDNILFFQDTTVRKLVEAKLEAQYPFVSANVINHEQLSAVHAHQGAVLHFEPVADLSRWCWDDPPEVCAGRGLPGPPASCTNQQCEWQLVPQGPETSWDWLPHDFECWKDGWKCAALVHFSFLQRWKDGTLDAFYFRTWHLSLGPDPCCTCPSHFLLFNSSRLPPDLLPSSQEAGDHSDCVAVGEGTLAAHYAYKPQEERLTRFTSVFQHYEALANAVTGGLSM